MTVEAKEGHLGREAMRFRSSSPDRCEGLTDRRSCSRNTSC